MSIENNKKILSIDEQIDEIWNSNSKIPFMQSKEILAFGYKLAIENLKSAITQNIIKTNEPVKEQKEKETKEDFIGTTKEFLEYTNQEIGKTKKSKFGPKESNIQIQYVKTKELDIEKARLKLLSEICGYISANRDLISTYEKLKQMRDTSERNVRSLENKYNFKR